LRPDVARKRTRWKARQAGIDPKRLVFIDETWVKTIMEPLRGWGPRQKRLTAHVPHGHWKTLTFVAALRHDRIDAPWVDRRTDQRRTLRRLCREGSGPDPGTVRNSVYGLSG
jgi:hypothetical protein